MVHGLGPWGGPWSPVHVLYASGSIVGNLATIFQKSQMPGGFPVGLPEGGGIGVFGIDRYIYSSEPDLPTLTV